MIFAFYFAHKDWFFNQKLFTSEQIFLFILGVYFLINGKPLSENRPKADKTSLIGAK